MSNGLLTALFISQLGGKNKRKQTDIETECEPEIREHNWSHILFKYLSWELIHTKQEAVFFFFLIYEWLCRQNLKSKIAIELGLVQSTA